MSSRRVRSPTVREGIARLVSEDALPYGRASDTARTREGFEILPVIAVRKSTEIPAAEIRTPPDYFRHHDSL